MKKITYNSKSWEIDIIAKRIIAWISNSKLTMKMEDLFIEKNLIIIIKKQINHLINEIEKDEWVDDKMIGCAAIILAGLSYQDKDDI